MLTRCPSSLLFATSSPSTQCHSKIFTINTMSLKNIHHQHNVTQKYLPSTQCHSNIFTIKILSQSGKPPLPLKNGILWEFFKVDAPGPPSEMELLSKNYNLLTFFTIFLLFCICTINYHHHLQYKHNTRCIFSTDCHHFDRGKFYNFSSPRFSS